jgi:TIR domain
MTDSATKQVFISHITDERDAAALLKETIQKAFGIGVSVFVSSDGSSLGGGEEWFTFVRDKARSAQILIALLSDQSADHRWVLFEAGVGDGAKATLIPVLFGRLTFGQLAFPLSGFHGRRICDISGIISDIAKHLGVSASPIDETTYASALADILKHSPRPRLELRPVVRSPREVGFELLNNGTMTVELVEIKAAVPLGLVDPNTDVFTGQDQIFTFNTETVDGRLYRVLKLNTNRVTRPSTGVDPLPAQFSSGMSPLRRNCFSFRLKSALSPADLEESIRTTISLATSPAITGEIRLHDLGLP